MCGRQGVGIPPSGGGTRNSGITTHKEIHLETAGDHRGAGGMPPPLLNLYRGEAETGDDLDDEMMGSGRSKRICVVDVEYV